MTDDSPWYRSKRGIVVLAVYGVLTLLALVLSTDPAPAGDLIFQNTSTVDRHENAIPPFVYLYAFLGAMAYAFTSVIAKFERDTRGVVRVGIRALAALPLAAGVFLLAGALEIDPAPITGAAFLVGLYVNLTLKALGGLADRLYGRVPGGNESTDGSAASIEDDSDGPEPE